LAEGAAIAPFGEFARRKNLSVCPDTTLAVVISGNRPHTGEEFSAGICFGRATPLSQIEIRWDLSDSTLGIFLYRECWGLYRYGPYRRRNRVYWRFPPQPPFTPAEIEFVCAKRRVPKA